MSPQMQSPIPTQVPQAPINPMMLAILRARAQQGLQGGPTPPIPNGLPLGGGVPTPNPTMGGNNATPRPSGATPTQQVMKSAQQAQSPLMDMETRNIAKQLVMKLMTHM